MLNAGRTYGRLVMSVALPFAAVACSTSRLSGSATGPTVTFPTTTPGVTQSTDVSTTTRTTEAPASVTASSEVQSTDGGEHADTTEIESAETGGPDLDDPTKQWDSTKSHLKTAAEGTARIRARGRAKVTPAEGKYIDLKPDDIVEANGELLLHFKKDRTYISQDFGGHFSNAMAASFVDEYGAGSARLGTRISLVDLGGGFSGVLAVGRGTASMRLGTDEELVLVIAPPTANGEALVLRLARAMARELAEVSKPGSGAASPRPATTVPTPPPVELLPVDSSDPRPATGIDPPKK
jgi:hypothetical protein